MAAFRAQQAQQAQQGSRARRSSEDWKGPSASTEPGSLLPSGGRPAAGMRPSTAAPAGGETTPETGSGTALANNPLAMPAWMMARGRTGALRSPTGMLRTRTAQGRLSTSTSPKLSGSQPQQGTSEPIGVPRRVGGVSGAGVALSGGARSGLSPVGRGGGGGDGSDEAEKAQDAEAGVEAGMRGTQGDLDPSGSGAALVCTAVVDGGEDGDAVAGEPGDASDDSPVAGLSRLRDRVALGEVAVHGPARETSPLSLPPPMARSSDADRVAVGEDEDGEDGEGGASTPGGVSVSAGSLPVVAESSESPGDGFVAEVEAEVEAEGGGEVGLGAGEKTGPEEGEGEEGGGSVRAAAEAGGAAMSREREEEGSGAPAEEVGLQIHGQDPWVGRKMYLSPRA